MATATTERPIVGISIGCHTSQGGREYLRLPRSYSIAVEQAGGVPLMIPPLAEPANLRRLLTMVDGLLLPGGVDVHPARYGEPWRGTKEVDEALDALELRLAEQAVAEEIPTLGICRGQQLLNVALGGTLVQDLPAAGVDHPQSGDGRAELAHRIELAADSRLAAIFGATSIEANSFHHQAVARPGRGLRVVGRSPDGVVEAVEHGEHPWLLAVQFHPEDLVGFHEPSRRLFSAFVRACAERARVAGRR